jgi:hypothetical protein
MLPFVKTMKCKNALSTQMGAFSCPEKGESSPKMRKRCRCKGQKAPIICDADEFPSPDR